MLQSLLAPHARPISVPSGAIHALPGHDFADAYAIAAPDGLGAPAVVDRMFKAMPGWASALMQLRNRLAMVVGLKPAPVSGFPILSQSPTQVILGFNDRHLDFRIVVLVGEGMASITTLVQRHNWAGRAYLAAVMPFHRLIAPSALSRLSDRKTD